MSDINIYGLRKLCFVDHKENIAYFTRLPLVEGYSEPYQWGDDWDDAPYEHNAELPYDKDGADILRIKFDSNLDHACALKASDLSVEAINQQIIPWMRTAALDMHNKDIDIVRIYAGCSPGKFKQLIRQTGGIIWIQELTS